MTVVHANGSGHGAHSYPPVASFSRIRGIHDDLDAPLSVLFTDYDLHLYVRQRVVYVNSSAAIAMPLNDFVDSLT